ncbi:MAG: hypothetical protein AB1492_03825 [Bacillota bacterium]
MKRSIPAVVLVLLVLTVVGAYSTYWIAKAVFTPVPRLPVTPVQPDARVVKTVEQRLNDVAGGVSGQPGKTGTVTVTEEELNTLIATALAEAVKEDPSLPVKRLVAELGDNRVSAVVTVVASGQDVLAPLRNRPLDIALEADARTSGAKVAFTIASAKFGSLNVLPFLSSLVGQSDPGSLFSYDPATNTFSLDTRAIDFGQGYSLSAITVRKDALILTLAGK